MKIQLFPFIFERTGPETMLKFKISRFCTSTANRERCTTKSDRLGEDKHVWNVVKTVLAAAKSVCQCRAELDVNIE